MVPRESLFSRSASSFGSIADEPVNEFAEREDRAPACCTNAEDGYEDEERFEVELRFGEEGKAEVDEDKILGELGHDLEDKLCGQLCAARHVVVRVVLEADSAEQERHNT